MSRGVADTSAPSLAALDRALRDGEESRWLAAVAEQGAAPLACQALDRAIAHDRPLWQGIRRRASPRVGSRFEGDVAPAWNVTAGACTLFEHLPSNRRIALPVGGPWTVHPLRPTILACDAAHVELVAPLADEPRGA